MVRSSEKCYERFLSVQKINKENANNLSEIEIKRELETFKIDEIKIINPEKKSLKDLRKYKDIRKFGNYNDNAKEIYGKLTDLCNQCFKNCNTNQSIFKGQPHEQAI
jgi:DNA repair ATPase RecN